MLLLVKGGNKDIKKCMKLRDLIERLEELVSNYDGHDDTEVHVNIGEYDDTVFIKNAYIASNDKYDYISIDTELSK